MYWGRPVKIDTALYPISTQRNLAVTPDDISMPLNPDLYGSFVEAVLPPHVEMPPIDEWKR